MLGGGGSVELAGGGDGQGGGGAEAARALVGGETARELGRDAIERGRAGGIEDEGGGDDLPPARVGNAEDHGARDARDGLDDALDLGGVDVFAAGDDEVGAAGEDVEAALFIEGAEVAGIEPGGGVERREGRAGERPSGGQ